MSEDAYEDSAMRMEREICKLFAEAKAATLAVCDNQHGHCLKRKRRAVRYLIGLGVIYTGLVWFNLRDWWTEDPWKRGIDIFVVGCLAFIFARAVADTLRARRYWQDEADSWLRIRQKTLDSPIPKMGDL